MSVGVGGRVLPGPDRERTELPAWMGQTPGVCAPARHEGYTTPAVLMQSGT